MNPTELILKKRNGDKLTREELSFLIDGYLNATIPDYQLSAFLMAVYFQKMEFDETTVLTDVMLHSGTVVDLSSINGVKVDKHSTGGVGDKVSLILAPMVAACGVPVPMISGRGLGHTGGTLDKLESIPGFRTDLSLPEYKRVLSQIGVAMIGQTKEIAPADKKLYALRDVTGTVECIPLIASSIMSKKLAEGIDALVLDIKTGRGAFMQSEESAIDLAKTLIAVGEMSGKTTIGLLTGMDQPLGRAVGNWLEVVECVDCMGGREVSDLMEVTYALGGAMLLLGKKSRSMNEGIQACRQSIQSGAALRKFKEMVKLQGGDIGFVDGSKKYSPSQYSYEVKSSDSGYVESTDAREIGFTSLMLGAGRMKVDDVIDPKAGLIFHKKIGDNIRPGDTICTVYTDKQEVLESASRRLRQAFVITKRPPALPPLIHAMIDKHGVHRWEDTKR